MDTPTPRTPTSPSIPTSHLPLINSLNLLDSHPFTTLPPPLTHSTTITTTHSRRPRTSIYSLPPELISLIAYHLYYSLLPSPHLHPSPDPPLYLVQATTPYTQPTFLPTPSETSRAVFLSLASIDHRWGSEARKWLWRNVVIGMPRAFENILKTIEEYKLGLRGLTSSGRRKRSAGGSGRRRRSRNASGWTIRGNDEEVEEGRRRGEEMMMMEDSLDVDLRWGRMMGGTTTSTGIGMGMGNATTTTTTVGTGTGAGVEEGDWQETSLTWAESTLNPLDSPLLYTKSLSFSKFRTAGLRRSVRQGSHERFVTPHRLLTLLRGTRIGKEVLLYPGSHEDEEESVATDTETNDSDDDDNVDNDEDDDGMRVRGRLESVGFTEFMDSAISKSVLDELLFRGGYLAEYEEKKLEPVASPSTSPLYSTTSTSLHLSPPLHPGRLPLERRSSGTTFLARHLQSSHSRSPSTHGHGLRLAPNVEEVNESATDDDEEMNDVGAGERRSRRRGSGSTFAPAASSYDDDGMDIEDRGRERGGRSEVGGAGGTGAGRGRRNRSIVPPSAFISRSMSVPAHHHAHLHRSSSLGISERSSSVPAAYRRSRVGDVRKTIQVLEGSKDVRPIRALDLCGCVSASFLSALDDVIATYKLGPAGLFPPMTMSAVMESRSSSDEDDDGDDETRTEGGGSRMDDAASSSRWSGASSYGHEEGGTALKRKLKRIYFPHLRRLGLSSALLPTPLLTSLVLSFPYLTHLDLSSTLTSPILLKQLAIAGQSGPGGRAMRLAALSLARCRFATGEAIVGLLCGDCPPFTSMSSMGEEGGEESSWGSGEVVMDLIDLSLFGDAAYPSPLSGPELRLLLTVSPAFTGGKLRTIDLSSTPLTDAFLLDHFPPQPQLIELGLSSCRGITIKGVAQFLIDKAPGVEILTLSGSCPLPLPTLAPNAARRSTMDGPTLSVMELHMALLATVASITPSSEDPVEAERELKRRKTNLRVVELDEKTLEGVRGGAGDWKVVWGKGRRGWYVDTATTSISNPPTSDRFLPRTLSHLPRGSPRREALLRCAKLNGIVSGEMGWHTRKMEVMRGDGMMGREEGLLAFHGFQV